MKHPEILPIVLIEHLDNYKRQLTVFLKNEFVEHDKPSSDGTTMRHMNYTERLAILSEIVALEKEIRVLSYYADTMQRFAERLMEGAESHAWVVGEMKRRDE